MSMAELIRQAVRWYCKHLGFPSSPAASPPEPERSGDTADLENCRLLYFGAVDAYGRIKKALQEIPVPAGWRHLILSVANDLAIVGQAVAVVPELAEQVQDGRRIFAIFRRQAVEQGFVFRYDKDAEAPETANEP